MYASAGGLLREAFPHSLILAARNALTVARCASEGPKLPSLALRASVGHAVQGPIPAACGLVSFSF